jgi:hypothetical protein
MPGLDPGIHVLVTSKKDVDGRVKPGHDENQTARPRIMISTAAVSSSAMQP